MTRPSTWLTHAIIIGLAVVLAAGCVDQATGKALADAGFDTSTPLVRLYDSLVQETRETLAIIVVKEILRGNPLPQQDITTHNGIVAALEHRVELARSLSSAYGALKDLSSSNAPTNTVTAADTLISHLKNLGAIPPAVDPTQLLNPIIQELENARQAQGMSRSVELLAKVLNGVRGLFEHESAAYRLLADRRDGEMRQFTKTLVEGKMVSTDPLVQQLIQPFGLPITSTTLPATDRTTTALEELIVLRIQQLTFLSKRSIDSMDRTLSLLADGHQDVIAGRPLHVTEIRAALLHVTDDLDAIDRLRKGAQPK